MGNGMGYEYKVWGEFVARKEGSGKELIARAFEITVPMATDEVGIARSALQAGLVQDKVRAEVGESYVRIRKCQVQRGKPIKEHKPDRSELLLIEAATLGCIPSDIVGYGDSDARCEAVQRAITRFKAQREQRAREEERGRLLQGGGVYSEGRGAYA